MTMNRTKANILLFVSVLLLNYTDVSAQEVVADRSISGTVVYPDDKPAKGFVVVIVGASATATAKARGFTNNDGMFNVDRLRPGDYVVTAYKEEENSGYPLGLFRFYRPQLHQVRLSGDIRNSDTKVKLGKPLVKLAGRITRTNGDGAKVQISMHLADDKSADLSFASADDGFYKASVPTGVPIVMVVTTADGQNLTRTFTADSTSTMHLDIEVPATRP